MIYICCGHEHSIGLEVLFKSINKMQKFDQSQFVLYARKSDIRRTLNSLKIDFCLLDNNSVKLNQKHLSLILLEENSSLPITTVSIKKILENINYKTDILLTLPTSKDQLLMGDLITAGYTEFLRKTYEKDNLCMYFSAPGDHVLLITDHIPLSQVSSSITSKLIIDKIKLTLEYHQKYFFSFDEVIIAGINPHAGENGLLGSEDNKISCAITKLKKNHSQNFIGPISGDTLHFYKNTNIKQLKVYMYHDQGLPTFKAINGIIGLNITLGLPFLRMSVDHGTAFDLFEKNIADETGCLYMLEEALKSHIHLNS